MQSQAVPRMPYLRALSPALRFARKSGPSISFHGWPSAHHIAPDALHALWNIRASDYGAA